MMVLPAMPVFSAEPGIDIANEWNVYTWTYNAASPTTELDHSVWVVDYDGIADGGDSHSVTVTYPNGGGEPKPSNFHIRKMQPMLTTTFGIMLIRPLIQQPTAGIMYTGSHGHPTGTGTKRLITLL